MRRRVLIVEMKPPIDLRETKPKWIGHLDCGHTIEASGDAPPWDEKTREAECATCEYVPRRNGA